MGTKNNPGDINCYGNANGDEPIFVLRSTDKSAPAIIRIWACFYKTRKEQENSYGPAEHNKYESALEIARHMEKYYNENI